MTYDFQDCLNHASNVNPFVEAYVGKSPVNTNSYKYRDIAERFKQGLVGDGLISLERLNPLRICFRPDKVKKSERIIQQEQQQQEEVRDGNAENKDLSIEELQKMPIPDSIERLGHSDLWRCKGCKIRGDIWELKKHALYYCKSNKKK
jgi:hypothetical protein